MTYRYAFLKFPNKGQAIADGFKGQSKKHFLYDAGQIKKTDGIYDPVTGEVITPPTFESGAHFNLLLLDGEELPEALKPYEVQVNTPSNVVLGFPYEGSA